MPGLVDTLTIRLNRSKAWPPDFERPTRQQIAKWAAFAASDEKALRTIHNWPNARDYVVDNLAAKISGAYSSLLYGEDPRVTPGTDADRARLEDLTRGMTAEFRTAVEMCVSEGEVWWRLCAYPEMSPNAILTWHSRIDVIPLTQGRRCGLAAFVSVLGPRDANEPVGDSATPGRPVWRHLEIHTAGSVTNMLFRGTYPTLGDEVPLTTHPEVEDLPEEWAHGLPMLAGRIVNKWGKRGRSVSEYQGVWTRLLKLNEAATIGAENMRLTAKKRLLLPMSAAPRMPQTGTGDFVDDDLGNARGRMPDPPRWDAGEDVIFEDPLDIDEAGGVSRLGQVMEYSFDADALIKYEIHLVETTLNRCDIVAQWVGLGDFGQAISGTARKVTLLPTTNAAEAKARAWDDEVPSILCLAQQLEALSIEDGGLGIAWASPTTPPIVERTQPLPEDDMEVAMRQSTLATARLMSAYTGIKERYPDWTDDQINEEISRIRADERATLPLSTFQTAPSGTDPEVDPAKDAAPPAG